MIRQADASLRALVNMCRHRASPLVEPQGNGTGLCVFSCPYHSWTYELDGALRSRPAAERAFDDVVWNVEPSGVGRSRFTASVYAPAEPDSERERNYFVKNLDLLLDVTGTEDFPALEDIQRNLASGAMEHLVYGKIEPPLVHFTKGQQCRRRRLSRLCSLAKLCVADRRLADELEPTGRWVNRKTALGTVVPLW